MNLDQLRLVGDEEVEGRLAIYILELREGVGDASPDIQRTLNALSAYSEHENASRPTAEQKVHSSLSCPSLRLTS